MSSRPSYEDLLKEVQELKIELSSLQESRRQLDLYNTVFMHALHEVHIWGLVRDENGSIKTWKLIDANPVALKSWGMNLDEIKGKSTDEIFVGANATEQFLPIVEKIFNEKKPYTWENFFPGTNQTLFMISVPLDEMFISTGIDISELRTKEKELSALQSQMILDGTGIGLWRYDLKNKEISWDDQMYKLYEKDGHESSKELSFDSWMSLVHNEDKERVKNEFESAILGTKNLDTFFRIKASSDEVKHIRAKGIVLKFEDNSPYAILGTNWDFSKEVEYQNLLIEAKVKAENFSDAKSLFLANMSHEIRTPMNSIMGFTDLLLEESHDETTLDYLKNIQTSSTHLLNVINDILDYSKIESGKVDIDYTNFNLTNLLNSIVESMRILTNENVRLTFETSKHFPTTVYFDQQKISQIITNLISNAIKFTLEGEILVHLELEESNKTFVISVCDTGIGIQDDKKSSIFDDFTQADNSIRRRFGGTGLGLSITKSLVKILKGEISAEDNQPRGSIFKIRFPYLEPKSNENENLNNEDEGLFPENIAKKKALNILIAEDNILNQKVAKGFLKSLGYNADIANDGEEVLNALKNKKYDLIFMDCHMPLLDGLETTRKIIKEYNNDRPYICALSASAMKEDVDKALNSGMDSFMAKPLSKRAFKKFITTFNSKK